MIKVIVLVIYIAVTINAHKNVLFVIVDDLKGNLNDYGVPVITPNFNFLANAGTNFYNAYVQQALCAPSRNSLLTSRRPDTTKLYDFYSYWRDSAGNFTTLPQYLKQKGYLTYSIGKVFHPGASSNFTDDAPYSWSYPPWHPSTDVYKDSPVCKSNGGLHKNIVCPVKLKDQPEETLPDIQSTEEAIRFLRERKNSTQPFFLALGYHKPHIPLKFPEEFLEYYPFELIKLPVMHNYPPGLPEVAWSPYTDLRRRDDIKNLNISFPFGLIPDTWGRKIIQSYLASVTYVDSLFGKVLEALKENDKFDNTVIILLGDNGWSLGEHGDWTKYTNFDVSLQVPLMLRVPGVTGGRQAKDIVELIDIFPTLVDVLGFDAIPACPLESCNILLCTEGISFSSVLTGSIGEKKYAFSQYPRPGKLPKVHPNWDKPHLKQMKLMGYSVRTRRHRFTLWVPWNPVTFKPNWKEVVATELYDHVIDAQENLNLAGRPGLVEVEESLKKILKRQFTSCDINRAFDSTMWLNVTSGLRMVVHMRDDIYVPNINSAIIIRFILSNKGNS